MSVSQKACLQAIALLRACGARYAIIHEGATYGEPFPEPPAPETRKRRRLFPRGHWDHLTQPYLQLISPGSSFRHTCATKEEARALRSTLTSYLGHKYGDKSYISEVAKDNTVEVLFVAPTNGAALPE